MRNNRGEWEYRESYDKDNYKFVRQSGIKQWEFDDKQYVKEELKWLVIAIISTVVFSGALGLLYGYLTGGA